MEVFKDDNYEKFVGSLSSLTNLPCFRMWPLLYRVTFLHLVSLPMLTNIKNKKVSVKDFLTLFRNVAFISPFCIFSVTFC